MLKDFNNVADDDNSKVVKEDKMIEAVLEHLTNDFFPDEPVFRSLVIVKINHSAAHSIKIFIFIQIVSGQVCGSGLVQRFNDVRVQDLS